MDFKELPKLSSEEASNMLEFFLNTNLRLEKEGEQPNAISFLGHAGISKTSTVMQTADRLGLDCQILRLSNIDGAEDLIGFPIKEYLLGKKDDKGNLKKMWVKEKNYSEYIKRGWHNLDLMRTAYAPPAWLTQLNTDQSILLIDDYNRGSQRFMQALMSIVNERSYYSWDLPKGCTVVLTGNPADDGEYFVSAMDDAQKSRFFEFGFKFNIDSWVNYAEKSGVDSRCINFMISNYSEILYNSDNEMISNPRQWTKFFNAIKYIEDFSSVSSLNLIQTIGAGIIPSSIHLFTMFINKKLDKLPEVEWILNHSDYEKVKKTVKDVLGDLNDKDVDGNSKYKAEIASMLNHRIISYLFVHYQDKPVTDKLIDRLEMIFNDQLFSSDLIYRFSSQLLVDTTNSTVSKKFRLKMMKRKTFIKIFKDLL